ncbi:MAG TPA: hypothetical protein V6C89_10480 [Drouetiella sp.]|jgi:hypothetical protein
MLTNDVTVVPSGFDLAVERTQFTRLWEELKGAVQDANEIELNMHFACEQIAEVDKLPRHDTIVDDSEFDFALFNRCAVDEGSTLRGAIVELQQAQHRVEKARKQLAHRLSGIDKVNIADRLQRHLTEGQALLDSIRKRARFSKIVYRAFEVRRQYMMMLFIQLDSFHGDLTRMRAERKSIDVFESSCARLLLLAEQAARIRARVAKWRDNPSQRIGSKLRAEYLRFISVRKELNELRLEVQYDCRRGGTKFYNRQGEC